MSSFVIRLDYATFNFDAGSMSLYRAGSILAGDLDLKWFKKGLNENAPSVSPFGLRWTENNGYAARPHKLEVSGVGCDHFGGTLPALRDAAGCQFSRLDFAFDCICSRSDWRSFICDAFSSSLNSERERKVFRLSGSGEAMTIYIGSRSSSKFFRIYNKTLEDPDYVYTDSDGNQIEVPDDCCVVRYEVELKRHVSVQKGQRTVYDPSPLFDAYYSFDKDEFSNLANYIKKLWLSYGNQILLPEGFQDAEFTMRSNKFSKTQILLNSEEYSMALEDVQSTLHDYPHSFDRTIRYVCEKFGAYIPYIIANDSRLNSCFSACRLRFGFIPDLYIESTPSGFFDLDCADDSSDSWSDEIMPFDQLSFYGKEGGN